MGIPHPNSPNGCWLRHGYRSELPPGRPLARCRNVYAPDGSLVLVAADYEKQFDYCRAKGLLLPACEVERIL